MIEIKTSEETHRPFYQTNTKRYGKIMILTKMVVDFNVFQNNCLSVSTPAKIQGLRRLKQHWSSSEKHGHD